MVFHRKYSKLSNGIQSGERVNKLLDVIPHHLVLSGIGNSAVKYRLSISSSHDKFVTEQDGVGSRCNPSEFCIDDANTYSFHHDDREALQERE